MLNSWRDLGVSTPGYLEQLFLLCFLARRSGSHALSMLKA